MRRITIGLVSLLACGRKHLDAKSTRGPGDGDEADWTWDGPDVKGHLQACGPDRMIELTVYHWDEDDELGAEEALIALSYKVVIAAG